MRSVFNTLLLGTALLVPAAGLQGQSPVAVLPGNQEVRPQTLDARLSALQKSVANLDNELAAVQGAAPQDDKQKNKLNCSKSKSKLSKK